VRQTSQSALMYQENIISIQERDSEKQNCICSSVILSQHARNSRIIKDPDKSTFDAPKLQVTKTKRTEKFEMP